MYKLHKVKWSIFALAKSLSILCKTIVVAKTDEEAILLKVGGSEDINRLRSRVVELDNPTVVYSQLQ